MNYADENYVHVDRAESFCIEFLPTGRLYIICTCRTQAQSDPTGVFLVRTAGILVLEKLEQGNSTANTKQMLVADGRCWAYMEQLQT